MIPQTSLAEWPHLAVGIWAFRTQFGGKVEVGLGAIVGSLVGVEVPVGLGKMVGTSVGVLVAMVVLLAAEVGIAAGGRVLQALKAKINTKPVNCLFMIIRSLVSGKRL